MSEHLKGTGAKNDTSKSPGCFNQILTFESRKWSPVATFQFWNNNSALSFFNFLLFQVQNQGKTVGKNDLKKWLAFLAFLSLTKTWRFESKPVFGGEKAGNQGN